MWINKACQRSPVCSRYVSFLSLHGSSAVGDPVCVCVGNVLASPPSVATGETGSSLGCELCPDGVNGMRW